MKEIAVGNTLFDALYHKFSSSELVHRLNDFFVHRYSLENTPKPFLTIDDYESIEDSWNTKGREETFELRFHLICSTGESCADLIERVMFVYDYIRIQHNNNRRVAVFEWQGSLINEMEPGIWLGQLTYNVVQEKDIP